MLQDRELSLNAGNVYRADFSADGSMLVTVDSGRNLKVWDTQSGTESSSTKVEEDVDLIALSADNEYLATSSGARTTVRALEDGSRIAIIGHYTNVKVLAFDGLGSQLTTVSADGVVLAWPLPGYPDLIGHSCSRLARKKLTEVEWEDHLKGEKYDPVCESIHE